MSTAVIATEGLGRRFRNRWALSDCTVTIPAARVVGLVGPNGAGKSTLLNLVVGLLAPSAGRVEVLGEAPAADARQLGRIGFVAQDTPLFASLSVEDHLRFGNRTNPRWDMGFARRRLAAVGLDPRQKAGQLSGGQRAQLALTLAVAKGPELLVLDEPVASLDPLARREFLQSLMEIVAEQEVSVVLSSHLMADVERVCDHLVVLVDSRVRVAEDVDDLLAGHHLAVGPADDRVVLTAREQIVSDSTVGRQRSLLIRAAEPPALGDRWVVRGVGLEDVVLAHMRERTAGVGGGRHLEGVAP